MTCTRDDITRRQRLTWTLKDPRLALENRWYQDPKFLAGLCDRCDQLSFVDSDLAFELGRRTVEIAEASVDPHLLHRAYGALSHAYLMLRDHYWAGKSLETIRDGAIACCPRCRSDYFRRLGDLMMERRDLDESLSALDRALEEGGRELGADARGRIHSVRGVTHHLLGHRDRALADSGSTLELVSLTSPRGFFVDSPAFIAIFVAGGDPRHDEHGSALLAGFDRRIRGLRGWGDWLTRRLWAGAHLKARLGDYAGALRMFRRAYARLLADGLAREAVAVALDYGQLLCRGRDLPWGRNSEKASRVIERCRDRRGDLGAGHREILAEVLRVLDEYPESAFDVMVSGRRSFIAPVPGVMAERLERRAAS